MPVTDQMLFVAYNLLGAYWKNYNEKLDR